MALSYTPPEVSLRTEYLETDGESDRDSGVGEDAGEDADSCHGCVLTDEEMITNEYGTEENRRQEDFTVFVAFQGNMDDDDFSEKLDTVLNGIPDMLNMGWFHML